MRFAGISLSNYMDGMDNNLLATTGQRARSQEMRAGMMGQGRINKAGIAGVFDIASAELGGAATEAAGASAGMANAVGGGLNALGTFGGAAIGKYMNNTPKVGVPRTSPKVGIPGSVAPGTGKPYYGPAW